MPRVAFSACVAGLAAVVTVSPAAQDSPARVGRNLVTTEAVCAADLGMGAKSRRRFCDVIISRAPGESVAMEIPAHTGPATLRFDLHNRFVVSDVDRPPAEAFERDAALVAIVAGPGQEIVRAAVTREYRTIQDLFDRISGGGRDGGFKAVAPGGPENVVAIIPDGVSAIGILGVSLERQTAAGRATYDAPGRPVAIASNFRIEYTPR